MFHYYLSIPRLQIYLNLGPSLLALRQLNLSCHRLCRLSLVCQTARQANGDSVGVTGHGGIGEPIARVKPAVITVFSEQTDFRANRHFFVDSIDYHPV